jgi:hypothetical protein
VGNVPVTTTYINAAAVDGGSGFQPRFIRSDKNIKNAAGRATVLLIIVGTVADPTPSFLKSKINLYPHHFGMTHLPYKLWYSADFIKRDRAQRFINFSHFRQFRSL